VHRFGAPFAAIRLDIALRPPPRPAPSDGSDAIANEDSSIQKRKTTGRALPVVSEV
jgi:hypothetical protein